MTVNETTEETLFKNSEISLPRSVRFSLLLLFDIPSIICTIFLLYHLILDRTLRNALHNHVIILLLILGLTTQLIDIPFYLAFIANSGMVKPTSPATCLAWWFVAFGMYNGGTILMAWTAFERHIFIFYYQWISTRKGRVLVHYLPIIILLLYTFIFYIYTLFFLPCESVYEYTLPICGTYPCYQENYFLHTWDIMVNNIVPSLLVAFASIALLIRVIRQKYRLNQHVRWRRQRKMTVQLVSLSVLNILFNIPLNLVSLAHVCGLPKDYGVEAEHYFYFSCYFLICLFPFVCLFSYSELRAKVKWRIPCRTIRPKPAVVSSVWATNGHS
jgi:hypothetical protein